MISETSRFLRGRVVSPKPNRFWIQSYYSSRLVVSLEPSLLSYISPSVMEKHGFLSFPRVFVQKWTCKIWPKFEDGTAISLFELIIALQTSTHLIKEMWVIGFHRFRYKSHTSCIMPCYEACYSLKTLFNRFSNKIKIHYQSTRFVNKMNKSSKMHNMHPIHKKMLKWKK